MNDSGNVWTSIVGTVLPIETLVVRMAGLLVAATLGTVQAVMLWTRQAKW